jgi:arginase
MEIALKTRPTLKTPYPSLLTRRQCLAAAVRLACLSALPAATSAALRPETIYMLGVPLRAGSLYPGSEDDARAFRDVHLVEQLRDAGVEAVDAGNVAIPSFLPHHAIPPIRNWPAPRIAWDSIASRLEECLRQPLCLPLLVGCDCSVVIASAQALQRSGASDIHVLYVDGDLDAAAPDAMQMHSAASCALWLLTHASMFWQGPVLPPENVTILGPAVDSASADAAGMRLTTLNDVRKLGPRDAALRALAQIPKNAQVLLHFDIDVLQEARFPAAYFPHAQGLSVSEAAELFGVLSGDPRVRIIEVSEYSELRDQDRTLARSLTDIVKRGLSARGRERAKIIG